MATYLSVSPVHHGIQGQVCPWDSGGMPPYRQAQEEDDEPEGEYDEGAPSNVCWLLGWRLFAASSRGGAARGIFGLLDKNALWIGLRLRCRRSSRWRGCQARLGGIIRRWSGSGHACSQVIMVGKWCRHGSRRYIASWELAVELSSSSGQGAQVKLKDDEPGVHCCKTPGRHVV